eukprot:15434778-Alexandrium_andersonii.AAC.1
MAKRQGQVEWFKESSASDESLQALIRAYSDRSGVNELTGARNNKSASPFKFAQYKIAYPCVHEVLYDDEGELMHEQ